MTIPEEQRERWLMLFVMLSGVFLRFYHLGLPELWRDEYGTWWAIAPAAWGDMTHRVLFKHGQSPLYYYLVRFCVSLAGAGPVPLRLSSALAGCLALPLAWSVGMQLFRERHAALLSLAVFAFSEPLISFSQQARPYSLALLFALLSFHFYLKILGSDGWSQRLLYVLTTAAAFYTHYLFGAVIVIQAVDWMFHARNPSAGWLLTWFLLAVLCVPSLFQLSHLFGVRQSLNWVAPYRLTDVLELASELLNLAVLAPVTVAALAVGVDRHFFRNNRRSLPLLLTWFLLPIVLLAIVPLIAGIRLLVFRYFLCGFPAILFLTSAAMAAGRRDGWRKWAPPATLLAVTVAILLINLDRGGTFAGHPDEGWSRAAAELKAQARPSDLLLYETGFVESDELSAGRMDPETEQFVQWPLLAHWDNQAPARLAALPYRNTADTQVYVTRITADACRQNRVWLVGIGIDDSAAMLTRCPSLKIRQQRSFGSVRLVLFSAS